MNTRQEIAKWQRTRDAIDRLLAARHELAIVEGRECETPRSRAKATRLRREVAELERELRIRQYNPVTNAESRRRHEEKLRESGRCVACGSEDREPERNYCAECLEKAQRRRAEKLAKSKSRP